MAQTRDLIVRGSTGDTKSYIRIGDTTPLSVNQTSSTIQFLQDLSDSSKTFDTAGSFSAFRFRHDTVNGAFFFESRTGSDVNNVHTLLEFQDEGTVTFHAPVSFDDIGFFDITAGQIHVTGSPHSTNNDIDLVVDHTASMGHAIIHGDVHIGQASFESNDVFIGMYDENPYATFGSGFIYTNNELNMTGGNVTASNYSASGKYYGDGSQLQNVGGNSWVTTSKLITALGKNVPHNFISAAHVMDDPKYLSVFINGDLAISKSVDSTNYDYQIVDSMAQFNYELPPPIYLTFMYGGGK